jgi:D-glycerate 3-kinase
MSVARVQGVCSAAAIEQWLQRNTRLSGKNRSSMAATVLSLLSQFKDGRKLAVGISGAPGSGKSTLSRALAHFLNERSIPFCLLSLDDYYLGQAQRKQLAAQIHPLLRQRGVPGTHELERLLADFDQLRSGQVQDVCLPAFDKSVDDRAPEGEWRTVEAAPQVIILEGWCIGATPPEKPMWRHPVNELERTQDADQQWRTHIRHHWLLMHNALRERLDRMWYIRVPGWNSVIEWRWQQEQERAPRGLNSRKEVARFLAAFERIFRHMQKTYPQWADLVIVANAAHDLELLDENGR